MEQRINTRNLKIQLTDGENTELPGGKLYTYGIPGTKFEKEVCVRNTADTALYTRITIKKSWGEYSEKQDFEKDFDSDASLIDIRVSDDWLMIKSDDQGDREEIILYCRQPVLPGDTTNPFMNSIELSDKIGNEYAGKDIELQVTADGVQYLGSRETDEDAMLSEWGVYPVIDEKGWIARIEE